MKYVDRHLVTIYATQKFLDFVKEKEPRLHRWDLNAINDDPGAYLIEVEDQNCYGNSLREHYIEIMKNEVGNILAHKDRPESYSYELFCEWFTYKYHTDVSDMLEHEE